MNIKLTLTNITKKSLRKNGIKKCYNIVIIESSNKLYGDYQVNGIMQISKEIKKKPEELCKDIIKKIKKKEIIKNVTFSYPCFINFFLNIKYIEKKMENIITCKRLSIKKCKKKRIVIDYSSPNIAKEMHVGHLRSTVIGDSMARIMEFLGNDIIRENHIGDWGHQYGMLIAYLNKKIEYKEIKNIKLNQLENIYKKAKKKFDNSKKFKKESKKYLIKLYKNDYKYIKIWKKIVKLTLIENEKIYKNLNISLKRKHVKGESFYKNMLEEIVLELKKKKIAKKKNGNVIIYLKKFRNKLGEKMGVIIQNKDKTFLYSTIDIACIKHRIRNLKADEIIYYVDYRQKRYLKQILEIAKKAKYINKNSIIKHHEFGTILSKNNKPFMTRNNKTIKLSKLIKESIKKSKKIIVNKHIGIKKKCMKKISNIIGIGAIKYFELSKNRKKNYIFNWNNILKLNGNTAIYIQYSYSRIISILKNSKIKIKEIKNKIKITNEEEKNISIKVLQFEETIINVSETGYPNILCNYLYNLSYIFSKFYEKHNIIYEKNNTIKHSRIKLLLIVSKIIKKGLNLLGIKTLNKI
ncbi:arginine--tRNA ligase [Buchnera aphidicola (Ceratoglyphina bambusae)]|uniref:arginine--tRNA ligase n=1 Tax=Buchnera aphidicola TaxID=9 RepID=UPI0031B89C42